MAVVSRAAEDETEENEEEEDQEDEEQEDELPEELLRMMRPALDSSRKGG